jgi:mannose-1-phosphate guanylyltransferase/phosphomannomutase
MRTLVEASAGRDTDTTDGIRVIEPDGSWILALPDPSEAVTHLWAEAGDPESTHALLDTWAAIVASAGR